ncbi:MAG: hypothetical protein FJW86_07090 [Actinobacteria bacterium]|nr:hypothetical protein [Actinomycetota bacterium]
MEAVGRQAAPVTLARDRAIVVSGELGNVVPGAALQRGVTLTVAGMVGAGATSLAFELAAAVTATGEWAAAVDLDGTLGGEAAAAAGVALERFAVVRRVSTDRWTTVVAALLEGATLVMAEVPRHVRVGDARRLVARARERGSILVALETGARWPVDAVLRLHATGGAWHGLAPGAGLLTNCARSVRVEGQGKAAQTRVVALAG